MSDAIELDAFMTRMGRKWRVLVNRVVVFEGDATGAKNVKETLEQFAQGVATAAREAERSECLEQCRSVADCTMLGSERDWGRREGAIACYERIRSRSAAGEQGRGGGNG